VAPLSPETPVLAIVDPTCIVATGSIEVSSPVGTGFEYSIDGTAFQSFALFENLVPATYTVTVRNSEGCISSASAVIEVAPLSPETPVLAIVDPTCIVTTGSIEVSSPVGSGYEYSINGVTFQSSAVFENLASGNYTITVQNSEGCICSASAVIEVAPLAPETPVLATVNPTCIVATGSIEVSSPVGSGYEYSINGIDFQASALFENLVPATYTVTVRNSEGCISSASAVIDVAPLAPETPVLATVDPTCIVTTGSIEVTSPLGSVYEYSINGIDFQDSALFENLVPATYTVTVRNSEGCISSASAVIEVAPLAPETPVLATVDPTCIVATGSIEVSSPVGAGFEYSIDGTAFQSFALFENLVPATYTVTVRNSEGCISSASAVIEAAPLSPETPVLAIVDPTCIVTTGSIEVSSPVGSGYEYSINGIDFQASALFENLVPATYTVTVRNSEGCISSASAVIEAAPLSPETPVLAIVDPTCIVTTGSIEVSSPVGSGYEYSINGIDFQASALFENLVPATYNVTVRNSEGCISSASAVIEVAPLAPETPVLATVDPTCIVTTGSIEVTSPVGAGFEYSIDGIDFQASALFENLVPATYTVTVRNSEGCISSASAVIEVAPLAPETPVLATVDPTCIVATGSIEVSSPVGAGFEYSIDGIDFQASALFENLASSNYTITVRNSEGCLSAASAVIETAPLSPETPVLAIVDPTCIVTTGSIEVSSPVGAGFEYSIDGTDFQSSVLFENLASGNYTITVRNSEGCLSAASAVIETAPLSPETPVLAIVDPTCIVATGSIEVSSPVGAGFEYSIDGNAFQASALFENLVPATYTVTVRNSEGCISSASVVIEAAPLAPETPVLAIVDPTCIVTTGSIEVTSPVGAGFEYSIDGTDFQSSVLFENLASGNYTITVRNSEGCLSAASAVIETAPLAPETPVLATVNPTCIVATGSIEVTSPVGAGFEYSIDGITFQASALFENLASSNYTITVRNSEGCLSAASAVIETASLAPETPVLATVNPTCIVTTGSIEVTSPVGAGFEYSIDGTDFQSSVLFENLASGNYTITVQNSEGCISSASVVIEVAPLAPETPVLATVDPTCIVATGSIEVTSPVGAGFEYSIDGTAFQASALFENLVPATYTVTVRNSEGCVSSASAVIEVAPLAPETPVLATVNPTCIVTTGSIEVTSPVGAGFEYSIDGTDFQSSVLFENLASGNYTITVRNSEGCLSAASAVIETAPLSPETPVLATVDPTCIVATGSIEVTSPVGAGFEYSIDGTAFQSFALFENLVPATYTVTVRNSEGCISSASAVIEVAPLSPEVPTLAITNPDCFVATGYIEVSSPVGSGYEYSINGSDFQASALFENLVPATYTVTVRNSEGCISSASAVIEVAPLAPETPVLATVNPTCIVATGSIEVTSPVGSGYEYSINGIDFLASALFENLVPATYTVTVRNSEGCISSASAVIEVAPLAPETPVLATVNPTCIVTTGSIEVTSPVGAGFEYSIDGTDFQSSVLFENLASGNYTITVQNSEGCISSVSAVIEVAPLAPETPVLATVDPTCIVATGSIEVFSPVGVGYEYSIDGTAFQSSALFENLVPATYTVTVRNSEGCISSASAVIEVAPLSPETPVPTLAITNPDCFVATGYIEVSSPVGVGYEYSIDGTDFQSSVLFENLASGNYTITVRNSEGCISSASAVIEAAPLAPETPVLATVDPTCFVATGSIEVSSPVGAGFEYSIDGTAFQVSALFENLVPATYTVTVRNSEGCISSASAVIEVAPLAPETPVLATVNPTCIVATGSIEVTSPVGSGYEYSINGIDFQASALFENLASGNYTITVQNSEGCISSASAVIEVAPLAPETPVLATVNPTCIVATGSIEVTSPVGSGYEYSINGIDFQASALFENLVPATYTVTVRNSEGCISSVSAVIDVAPLAPETPVLATIDPTCIVATGSIEVTSPVVSLQGLRQGTIPLPSEILTTA
jgi:hypothetical protein